MALITRKKVFTSAKAGQKTFQQFWSIL